MRHYEIVFLVHPDQSEQVPSMVDRYKEMVVAGEGQVHRTEDWGRRRLAYPINDVHKAHYVMINIECSLEVLREIERNFKFNDSILRHLVIKQKSAPTGESPFATAKAEEDRLDEEKRKSAEARTTAATAATAAREAEAAIEKAAEDAPADETPAKAEEPAVAEAPAEEATEEEKV